MHWPTRNVFRLSVACAALTAAAGLPARAEEKCQLVRVLELPITMDRLRPKIPVKFNGKEANLILDSGAFYSIVSSAVAAQYDLKITNAPFGYRIEGVGGSTAAQIATVKEFTFVGVVAKNVEFLVGGSEVGGDGLLGQNLLENFDVEYDLGHGAIRLFRSSGCRHARLAYWLAPGEQYSSMPIDSIDRSNPHTVGVAYINGRKIKVAFDTGAFTSLLSADAAARAGIKTDSEGVYAAGYSSGIGRKAVKTYIASFSSFKIGDGEEIHNARLRMANLELRFADMLLGADFFVSHRIFVGNREHQLFLSYSGGPVFDLSKHADAPPGAGVEAEAAQEDSDAAEVARRGSALIARNDFAAGLPLISKAIAMSPEEPEYYFRRGNGYRANRQGEEALADFDQVIKLKQDFLPAYIPRAELELTLDRKDAALADLESVDRLAPQPAELRYRLGELYERVDRLPAAIEQYGLWINNHPDDSRMAVALARRCLDRALQNQQLREALNDCSTALRRGDKSNPYYSHIWVDRALVRLRMGDYDKATSDCDAALKMTPKNARALYLRGVVEAKNNMNSASGADLALAKTIVPEIADRFEHFGIKP